MNESSTKRRAWIKNAIIIFLAALLVLTLFSNTILNHSLPEVAVQYPQYAAIASRIRATGTVSANQSYDVAIEQTRTVASVEVRTGAQVKKGDVLFRLEEGDSAELDEAKRALQNLNIQLLQKMKQDPALASASSGASSNLEKQLANARASLTDERAKLAELQEELKEITTRQREVPSFEEQAGAESKKKQLELNIEYFEEEIARLKGKQGMIGGDGYYTPAEIEALIAKAAEAAEVAENTYLWTAMQYEKADKQVKSLAEQYEAAEKKYSNAAKAVTEYEGSMSGSGGTQAGVYEKMQALQKAQSALNAAQAEYNAAAYQKAVTDYNYAKNAYEEAYVSGVTGDALKVYADAMSAAKGYYDTHKARKDAVDAAQQALATAQQAYWTAQQNYNVSGYENSTLSSLTSARDSAKKTMDTLAEQKAEAEEVLAGKKEKYDEALKERDETKAELEKVTGYRQYDTLGEDIKALNKQLADAKTELESVQKIIDSASENSVKAIVAELNAKNREITAQKKIITSAEQDVAELEQDIADAAAKAEIDKQAADLTKQQYDIELQQIKDQIAAQEAAVKRIEENQVDGTIVSPVSGIVESLSVAAGQEAKANTTVASIVLSDMGYTMKTTVTAEQAARIKVGDQATIQWYYYGETPTARVVDIKNDASSQGQNKTVTLDVTGDVTPGTSLTFTLGDKNTSYDCVVPNSAVREDSDGKFVLIVTAKSTPLGNRYSARRVDVDVLASDETNSAVSGAISGEYVITNSTTPITAGMQVRLAEE